MKNVTLLSISHPSRNLSRPQAVEGWLPNLDQSIGCLLGLALGDAFGAPYEGGFPERLVWSVIGRTSGGKNRWTDDTAMALALADSLFAMGALDQDDLARRFADSYAWSRGFGPGAARVLKSIRRGIGWREASRSVYPQGSYGNGAAMRTPVLAVAYAGDPLIRASREAAIITHAHPDAITGAQLVAQATEFAMQRLNPQSVITSLRMRCDHPLYSGQLQLAEALLQAPGSITPGQLRRQLGSGVAATESCVTAIVAALCHESRTFVELLRFVSRLGGDVDTVGAMAGAIWGAKHGASSLPADLRAKLEAEERLVRVATSLHERFLQKS